MDTVLTSDWELDFSRLHAAAATKLRQGHGEAAGLLDQAGQAFLAGLGCNDQEFFDLVDDFVRHGEPSLETALAVTAVRRDYFWKIQHGVPSNRTILVEQLPAKTAEVEGIAWLPRLLEKAEAKLRGEMPPELMYGCGGDRRFFREHHVAPDEFLRRVWDAEGRHELVVAWIKG